MPEKNQIQRDNTTVSLPVKVSSGYYSPAYYDGELPPAVVEVELPDKFNGSQEAAKRYADGFLFGRKVAKKRDEVAPYVASAMMLPLDIIGGVELAAAAPAIYAGVKQAPTVISNFNNWFGWSKGGIISPKQMLEYRLLEAKNGLAGVKVKEAAKELGIDPRAYIQTQSKNFKKFLQEAPFEVRYHGTPVKNATEFPSPSSPKYKGKVRGTATGEEGIYVTKSPEYADRYTHTGIGLYTGPKTGDVHQVAIGGTPTTVRELPKHNITWYPSTFNRMSAAERKVLEESGYDIVHAEPWMNFGHDESVVFNPSQIKSLQGNRGTFSRSSDNIYKTKGGMIDRNKNLSELANKIKESQFKDKLLKVIKACGGKINRYDGTSTPSSQMVIGQEKYALPLYSSVVEVPQSENVTTTAPRVTSEPKTIQQVIEESNVSLPAGGFMLNTIAPQQKVITVPQETAVVETTSPKTIDEIYNESMSNMKMLSHPVSEQQYSELIDKTDFYKQKGLSEDKAIDEVISGLKSGDALKALQQQMVERGYYNSAPKDLDKLSKEQVKEIQRKLVDAGYNIGRYGENKDGVDGKVGNLTRKAYEQYVKDFGTSSISSVEVDGKIGPKTRRAAKEFYKDLLKGYKQDNINGAPEEDLLKQYDKILRTPVETSLSGAILGGVNDAINLMRWKNTVSKSKKSGSGEVPEVNMNWRVSDDQLARVVEFLPDNMSADSVPTHTALGKHGVHGRYSDTWDSPEYKEKNKTAIVEKLKNHSGVLGLIGTSLSSPGRGTLGGLTYRTTPLGIEISDGYEFAAEPSKVIISQDQSDSYNSIRANMNKEDRAKNKTTQRYLIPWDVYYAMKQK